MISEPVRFAAFAGRERESTFLSDLRTRAADGGGTTVAVVGDEGLGKTRLLDEFRATAGPVLVARCDRHAVRPLRPFSELLALPRASCTSSLIDEILVRVRALCAATPPLVLALEDLQWADEATLSAVASLQRLAAEQPLVFIVTCRSDEAPSLPTSAALADLLRRGAGAVHLEPLSRADIRYLIRATVADTVVPSADLKRIEDLAEGNPLYAEELLRATLDGFRSTQPGARNVPLSLSTPVLERLASLSPGVRSTLLDASVIGEQFESGLLAVVRREQRSRTLLARLQGAVEAGFLLESEVPGCFRFRQTLVREVLYSRLAAQSRRRLHEIAAQSLAAEEPSPDRLRELAYHWSGACDAQMAFEYNNRAGTALLDLSLYADAAHYFRRALDFCALDEPRRGEVVGRLALALFGDGELGAAKPLFREAIEAALNAGRFADAVRLIDVSFTAYWYDSDTDGGLDLVTLVVAWTERRLDAETRDRILVRAARFVGILAASGHADAHARFQHLVALAAPTSVESRISWHEIRGINLSHAGEFATALGELQEALRLAREHDVPSAVTRVAGNLAAAHQLICDLPAAERVVDFALLYEEERELSVVQRCGSLFQRADVLAHAGRLGEAADAIEQALAAGAEYGQFRTLSAGVGIPIALATGRTNLLARCADESVIDLALSAHRGTDSALIGAGFGRLFAEQGRIAEAQALLRAAVETAAASQFALDMLIVAARFGHERELERVAAALEMICARRPAQVRRAYTALLGAIIAQRKGVWALRKRLARDAADTFAALEMRLYEAQALEVAGLQVRARRRYEEIGARADAARLAAVFADRGDRGKVLTRRQAEIATLVASGQSNRMVARRLQLSEKTLEHHLTAIYRRLGVRSRQALQEALGDS